MLSLFSYISTISPFFKLLRVRKPRKSYDLSKAPQPQPAWVPPSLKKTMQPAPLRAPQKGVHYQKSLFEECVEIEKELYLKGNPLLRGKGFKTTKVIKQLLGIPSFYSIIERAQSRGVTPQLQQMNEGFFQIGELRAPGYQLRRTSEVLRTTYEVLLVRGYRFLFLLGLGSSIFWGLYLPDIIDIIQATDMASNSDIVQNPPIPEQPLQETINRD